jgi:hypothetical protein
MAMALHSVACNGVAARPGIIFVVAIFLEDVVCVNLSSEFFSIV